MANMKDTHRMRIYPPTPEHVAITKSVQEVEDMFTQDIRGTLYADGVGIVSVVEKLNERTVINKDDIVHPTQAYLELKEGENGIRLDAVAYGPQGNDIKFACRDGDPGDPISVKVEGDLTIVVTAPLDENSISDVVNAINGDTDAAKLVTASVIEDDGYPMIGVSETPLAGGVDVTSGEDGETFFDGVNIYVSDGESKKDVDNWLSAPLLPTLPTVIDLSDASGSYDIEDGKNSIVVLTDNNGSEIFLPAAIVGLRVTIINQDNADVSISPADGEYINGSDSSTPVTTRTSATFYCYADGKWATI